MAARLLINHTSYRHTSYHHTNYRQTSKGNPTTTPAAPSEPKATESARVVEARLAVDCA